MVQTETWRPSGAHIFSEKVASFGLVSLEVAKKHAQKYKKYDTKFKLCTPWEISPICAIFIFTPQAPLESPNEFRMASKMSNTHYNPPIQVKQKDAWIFQQDNISIVSNGVDFCSHNFWDYSADAPPLPLPCRRACSAAASCSYSTFADSVTTYLLLQGH